MLSKRVVVCLDVRDGKLAKSVKFVDTKDIGDPVEKARQYYEDGVDELVLYDITASSEKRSIMLDVVGDNRTQPRLDLAGLVRRLGLGAHVRLSGFVDEAGLADPLLL